MVLLPCPSQSSSLARSPTPLTAQPTLAPSARLWDLGFDDGPKTCNRHAGLHVLGPLVPAERSAARLAHQSGGLGVPSSNLGAPTIKIRDLATASKSETWRLLPGGPFKADGSDRSRRPVRAQNEIQGPDDGHDFLIVKVARPNPHQHYSSGELIEGLTPESDHSEIGGPARRQRSLVRTQLALTAPNCAVGSGVASSR
jgi:hypothetical protein